MRNHFKREGLLMWMFLAGLPLMGLAVTIVVQAVRGAYAAHASPNAHPSDIGMRPQHER